MTMYGYTGQDGQMVTSNQAPTNMAPLTDEQKQTVKNQQMASMLRNQSMAQPQGTQSVNGWAVPQSAAGGLAQIAQGLASNYLQNKVG